MPAWLFYIPPQYVTCYPVKMFEYLAAGLPVIASDFLWVELFSEFKCGLNVDPMTRRPLRRPWTGCYQPEKAVAMGQRGRVAVEAVYNWQPEAKKLVSLYQKLLASCPGSIKNMNSEQKITVIGGSGFVGTNFCQLLADHQIPFEIVDLKPSRRFPDKYRAGDVRDLDSLRSAVTGDVIVNLAAVHRDDVPDKTEYVRTNVLGAENTARICTEKGIRKIVFTSTVAVYGLPSPARANRGISNHSMNMAGPSLRRGEATGLA